MIKMIITAPEGVNLETFLDVVTAIVRYNTRESYGAYAEYSLADKLDVNSVDANLIDFNAIDAIAQLQEICPAEIHFEANADDSPFDGDTYDEDYFDDALAELYRYKPARHELDLFTEIVNAHHARRFA